MAQANVATGPPSATKEPLASPRTDSPQAYQKIIHFRDTVVSGNHARIKVPPSSVARTGTSKPSPSAQSIMSAPSSAAQAQYNRKAVNGFQMGNMQSFKANAHQAALTMTSSGTKPTTVSIPGVPIPQGNGAAAIHPILLEKSDDLVKAEIQLQRQRLEKTLKEQIDQKRASTKAAQPIAEQLSDIDLPDILAKALTLVQATAPPPIADAAVAANASDASDSFDENTFYSSQHDTPESHKSSGARDLSGDAHMQDTSPIARQTNNRRPLTPLTSSQPAVSHTTGQNAQGKFVSSANDKPAPSTTVNGTEVLLNQQRRRAELEAQVISSDSGAASRSDNSVNTDSDQPAARSRAETVRYPQPNANFRQHDSPLIRAHNLSPFAPQPAHVSPLAIARQPPMVQSESSILTGAPAQVSALRQEHAIVTSPESSPQGDKGSKKKNKKKNKKKADGRAHDAPASPRIKPEPRSPSPLSAPHFIRPQKRQRPSDRQDPEVIYDETRFERPVSIVQQERYSVAPMLERVAAANYERFDDPYARQVRYSVAPISQRPEPAVYEERRPDGTIVQYIQRVRSPPTYAMPYGASEPRPMRQASYSVANPAYRDLPTYERDGRASVRPHTNRARSRSPRMVERCSPVMAPPTAAPARVIVDGYGREYIEPPPASAMARRSVMPSSRAGEHGVAYERASARATSRMPGPESYEENGIIYRRASPTLPPRRVITQPEYGSEYRSYRERDYPTQSMGPPGQGFQFRGTMERRLPEQQTPQDYLARAASVRPVEPVPYYDRVQSSRPDMPPRQYAASVHPETRESRREAVPPVVREFSVRPAEVEMPRREYSVRPVESYYERPPQGDGEYTYIERPRAVQQELVYTDRSGRQMY
ncbi:hypothetical protein F5Y15DRAFT_116845 [Xylariaceae sp. FL0016]|nr:hypothetical protein F5Y15DRAFT_116845 [Xylariaceae sp. FL0016]